MQFERKEPRYQVNKVIRGSLRHNSSRQSVDFQVVNVSSSGMCVLAADKLPEHQELTIVINNIQSQVAVAWNMSVRHENKSMFKYGIHKTGLDVDFVEEFKRYGLLNEKDRIPTQSESEEFLEQFSDDDPDDQSGGDLLFE